MPCAAACFAPCHSLFRERQSGVLRPRGIPVMLLGCSQVQETPEFNQSATNFKETKAKRYKV